MEEAAVSILLIEDNPGDARLIEEMLPKEDVLLHLVGNPEMNDGGHIVLEHVTTLAEGIDALSTATPDAVLLDLGLPDSSGLNTLQTVLDNTHFVPIVVLTGLKDETVGIEAIHQGAQDYLVKGEVNRDLLVRALYHAIQRNRQEREREERREQLESLNRLNRIGHDVTHAVITTDTRTALEDAVCERIVAADQYQRAWIGAVDEPGAMVVSRVAICASDADDGDVWDVVAELAAEVIDTHQSSVVCYGEDNHISWSDLSDTHGIHGIAVVPILYEDFLYGILAIAATDARAFSPSAVTILERIGDVIGHAITALERKDALMTESILQLEFRVERLLEDVVTLASSQGGEVRFEHIITAEQLVVYGYVNGVSTDEVALAMEDADEVTSFRFLAVDGDWGKFELVTNAVEPLSHAVSRHGGSIRNAAISSGIFRFTVEFPTGRDKRQLIELVEAHCPGAEHHAQRTVDRTPEELAAAQGALDRRLTEKQRMALRSAFHAGFFEWPRESNGQELAERLGIAPATFSQHIRRAEQKVFSAILEEDSLMDDALTPQPN